MNRPWQPPDPKRFRPNEPSSNRPWVPPPHHTLTHQPHVHPSRQSQVPPPPPIAPYHTAPQPPPYYNPQPNPPHHLVPSHGVPPHHNPYHPPHAPSSHRMGHPPHASLRRNKSSDPRQRHRQHPMYNQHPSPSHNGTSGDTQNDTKKEAILDVLHIAADETKNFGAFAVTLSQIYGSRNVDGLPFGCSSSNSIEFDGRIGSSPILSFLPEAIDTPSKKVRVYELAPLAATDKRSYDELLAFFTKHERCPVVDKEYNMGILLYFVPPKLIFKKVDPSNIVNKEKDKRNKHKRKRTKSAGKNKTNFVELLKLNSNNVKEDRLWMISITSTSKYLMFKQKLKEKGSGYKKGKGKKKKKRNEADLSDIEISSDQDESDKDDEEDDSEDDEDSDNVNGNSKKNGEAIVKSDLIVALEQLYNKIGQKLPD